MNDLLKTTVTGMLVAPLAMYVTGYFPPDVQGEKHPPHEHVDATSSMVSAGPGMTIAPVYVSTAALVTRWTITP
jgi:hypothetical protein